MWKISIWIFCMTTDVRWIVNECGTGESSGDACDFRAAHMDTKVSIIGKVAEKSDKLIRLY